MEADMYIRNIVRVLLASTFFFYSTVCFALPEGYQVQDGTAVFSQPDSNTLNINTSDRVIINYNSFSIAQPESVNFYQPSSSSVALNRVTGGSISEILGTLTANGKIFLVNPNGVLFGPNSSVDVAALVASTLDIDNTDFMNSNYAFREYSGKTGSSVINQGYIQAKDAALIGQAVKNEGTIVTTLGSTVLASGSAMTLNLDTAGMISVAVDEAVKEQITVNGEQLTDGVKNEGTISADGGVVVLTAKAMDNVFNYAVNNEGIIEANALSSSSGRVELTAEGAMKSTGDIFAQGGTIQICADGNLILGGNYSADSIVFDPPNGGDLTIAEDITLDVDDDTTFNTTGSITIDANVTGKNGADLLFLADHKNKNFGQWDNGEGDIKHISGTISTSDGDGDLGNITIAGANVYLGVTDTVITDGGDITILAYNETGPAEIEITGPVYSESGSISILAQSVIGKENNPEDDAYSHAKVEIENTEIETDSGSIDIKAENIIYAAFANYYNDGTNYAQV
ncbi:MAG: filamentous hemagglutinin N-terminal domain-containing protein, partial [Candidatus Omnitrophica bacterium]|nr:filamentous hemagglutinin N-terminal domain-containing protein [Candidatus Omnitrophota bacterium]